MNVNFSRITNVIQKLQYSVDEQRRVFYGDWEDVVHASYDPFVRQSVENENQLQEIIYKLREITSCLADLKSAQSYQARIDDLRHTIYEIEI